MGRTVIELYNLRAPSHTVLGYRRTYYTDHIEIRKRQSSQRDGAGRRIIQQGESVFGVLRPYK